MSAFRHIHNVQVRSIEEELQEMGLEPGRVLGEIDRQTVMLDGGPTPIDLSGLKEGDESFRSLAEYGSSLLAEKCGKPHNSKDEEDDEDEDEEDEEGDDSEGMGEAKPAENDPEVMEAKWIQQAIKDPGRVREYLGVPEGEKIPMAKLDAAIEKLKATEEKDAEQKSLLSALVLAKRLKSGIGEEAELDEADVMLRDIMGDPTKMTRLMGGSPEQRAATASSPKFKQAMAKLTGKRNPSYDDVMKALMKMGVDRKTADQYAMFATERFEEKTFADNGELDEAALGIVKKARGAAARLAKRLRHREYLKKRGTEKREAKLYRKKFKRKIKRIEMKKLRKFGRKGLEKLHKMGRRVVQKSWSDRLANIKEELDLDMVLLQEPIEEEEMGELSIVAETALNAAETAWYLGEIFDAMDDEAGEVLFQLSRRSTALADAIEDGEPTEEQESQLETILKAVVRALAEYEDRGSPSLGEAIGVGMVMQGLGEWEDLVEYDASLVEAA